MASKTYAKIKGGSNHRNTDDSGFLAIIDPDAYVGFVNKDWTLDLLRQHFTKEMAARHMLIWGTGLEKIWDIQVAFQPVGISSFRAVTGQHRFITR